MTISPLSSLPALLSQRAQNPRAELGYLNDDGTIRKSSTYAQLLADAQCAALRLLSFGLEAKDVVIISLPDHQSSIRMFWACCFGMTIRNPSFIIMLTGPLYVYSRNSCLPYTPVASRCYSSTSLL